MKSGKLNFMEPSGPLQACNGTALPVHLPLKITKANKVRTSNITENYLPFIKDEYKPGILKSLQ